MTAKNSVSSLRKGQTVPVTVTVPDIVNAKCGNRRQCVIAHAVDRTFGLQGTGYVRVDARYISFTKDGERHQFLTPSRAKNLLCKFDRIGEKFGEDAARQQTDPITFRMELHQHTPVQYDKSPERKAQINAARNKRNAERRLQGLPTHTSHARYVGV